VSQKEAAWLFKVDMTEAQERCTKRFVRIANKNVKFLLSPEETVQFTAKNAIPSEKIAAVKEASIGAKKPLAQA
jgi:hypothetical protein